MEEVFIGIDCGGTNIRVACGDVDGYIISSKETKTFIGNESTGLEDKVKMLVNELMDSPDLEGYHIKAIGMGVPGIYYQGEVQMSPNIGVLDVKKLQDYYKNFFDIPFKVLNDVKCATLGEKWLGEAKDNDNFLYVNIGTGLSMALFLNGNLYMGENNASGELGYWIYDCYLHTGFSDGRAPLEEICSGKGVKDIVCKSYGSVFLNGFSHREMDTPMIFNQYKNGNSDIIKILDQNYRHLFCALANLCIILNPEKIIFGGGVSQDIDIFFDKINICFKEVVPFPPLISKSQLGREAGIYGAICLAMR